MEAMTLEAALDRDDTARRPGRPRDARVDRAVAEAVLDIMSEQGIAGLTIDRVAAQAGVGKATIYRRWPSKEDLFRAVVEDFHADFPDPDTGSLRGDLLALTAHVAGFIGQPALRQVAAQVLAAAQCEQMWAIKVEEFVKARRKTCRGILRRAKRRGELRTDLDEEVLLDMVVSPIFFRVLVSGGPVDKRFTEKYVDALVRGLANE
ncbi:MAG: TetR/AcrR family transcriptional regulator [Acidimicrobiales bacterium]